MKTIRLNMETLEFIMEDCENTRIATGIGRWVGSNGYGLYCVCSEDKVDYWKRRLINKRIKESKDTIKEERAVLTKLARFKKTASEEKTLTI